MVVTEESGSRSLWVVLAVLIVIVAVLVMVSVVPRKPPQAPTGPPATTVRLSYSNKIHYIPQIIAIRRGFFKAEGILIDPKIGVGGIEAAEAVASGAADMAVMGDVPGIIAVSSETPLVIVASYGGGERMHRIVVSADSAIRNAKDLEGKRLAVQHGSSTHGAFLLYCEKNAVDLATIKMVQLSPRDMPEAMLAGELDAMVGSEPWPTNVLGRCPGSRELAVLSGLGNNYPLVLVVRKDFAERNPNVVVRVLSATKQAIDFMHTNPDEAAEIMSKASGVPQETERKIMDTLEWGLTLDQGTIESLKKTAAFLLSMNKITAEPDWDKAIDAQFLGQFQGQAPSSPRLRLAYRPHVANAALVVAVREGFFEDEGIDLQTFRFTSGPACSEAVFSGSADIGTMGDSPCVIALARAVPVKFIACHAAGEHRHRLIVRKDAGIQRAEDLKGKTLAVQKGTSTYGGLLAWAARQNLDLSEVNVVNMGPSDMADALRTGGVDAAVASEPTPSLLEVKGYGLELATFGGLGNTYPLTVVVRDDFANNHPEVVVKALKAIRRGTQFVNDNRQEAAEAVAAATGLPVDVALKAMSRHTYELGLSPATLQSLRDTAQFLLDQKVIERLPDFEAMVRTTYLERLPKE